MIEFKQGNLLETKTEALVNTVNCVGVMGKGIALQFKQAFAENFRQYKKACDVGQVQPGQMFTVATRTENFHSRIYVLPEGKKKAHNFLEAHPEAKIRLEQVSNLIRGFETPYGMEMLATVHWVTTENPEAAVDSEQAIMSVQQWSDRKHRLFKPTHLRKAWERLHEQDWLN